MKARDFLVDASVLSVAMLLSTQPAMAQTAPATAGQNAAPASDQKTAQALAQNPAAKDQDLGAIIVTAQKREENVNKVPMSITAATAQQLRNAGVLDVRDLVKITPGLTFTNSQADTPIYTIRGIGFSDVAAAGRPAVTVYADQAPIPFSVETRGVVLDLQRVEILKGPQGTLFGTNTTGGAINFIAAKPTPDFQAGTDLSYGRFNSTQVSAFVSGPLSSTFGARIAVEHDGMDAWQKSYTTSEKTGVVDFWNGRLILDWAPTNRLKASFTADRWIDHSDTQVPQLIAVRFNSLAVAPELLNYPVAPHNDRAADFDAGRNYRKDNNFTMTNFRFDYEIADALTLTSLTSYSHYHENQLNEVDGVAIQNNHVFTFDNIRSVSEELRLAGSIANRGHFTLGANYEDDHVFQNALIESPVSSTAYNFKPLFGFLPPVDFRRLNTQDSTTKAAFASIDYNITDAINLYAGGRYTNFRTDFHGCTSDTGDGITSHIFSVLFKTTILPGQCVTLTEDLVPGIVKSALNQKNFSWRAGAQWTVDPRVIFYANVSRGYKAGSFPLITATNFNEFAPVRQESVLAYEAGFKAGLFDRALQINAAAFHYDYTDKQILGSVRLPIFGRVNRLINIPKSRINGAEFQLTALPVKGLRISASGTYISSRVTSSFLNFTPLGVLIDFKGQPLPNTPKWQLSGDAEYRWAVNSRLEAFLGGNVYYQTKANSAFGRLDFFRTRAYALLDLRAGVETEDGRWRASIWGRNVTNTYYWTAATQVQDTIVRYTGMPATYGVSLSFRYK